ncbi:hypothetical protein [Luteimonas terrae]|uniref:STAS/SEC14 domain-containing protein n=1 Tax=Luteimonas terrae TaxID=1530191 RepID=A0ABU1XXU0_9GAMM|nr:hypothetical protein [Luteimonas terrae]MDR7193576.1 hypothetical protein [Luteimonas terrae]
MVREPLFERHVASVPTVDEEATMHDLQIELRREPGSLLHAHVRGAGTFANTLRYWHAIAEAVEAQPAQLLLLVDELARSALTKAEWVRVVHDVGPRLGRLRIAHVKPHGLDTVEYCVLSAMGEGLDARVFDDARMASLWLRYGPVED